MLQMQERQYEAKLRKESAMSSMTKQQIQLFRLMLMPTIGYRDQYFELDKMKFSDAFQHLVSKKDPNHLVNQARQITRTASCHLNLKLFVKFIKTDGFAAPHCGSTEGFTLFIFKPGILNLTEAEEERRFQEMLKCDPKSEDWKAIIGDPSYHTVNSKSDATDMLSCCIDFLHRMSDSDRTVASAGYIRVKEGIERNRYKFEQAQQRDPLFYTKFIHYVDSMHQLMFDDFFEQILELRSNETFQIDSKIVNDRNRSIDEAITWVRRLQLHNFALPPEIEHKIQEAARSTDGDNDSGDDRGRKRKREQEDDGGRDDGGGVKTRPMPQWKIQKINHDADEWCLPAGKAFADYFGDDTRGGENREVFKNLLVKHHNKKTTRGRKPFNPMVRICLKHAVEFKCKAQCPYAHRPRKFLNYTGAEEVKDKIDQAFKRIYK